MRNFILSTAMAVSVATPAVSGPMLDAFASELGGTASYGDEYLSEGNEEYSDVSISTPGGTALLRFGQIKIEKEDGLTRARMDKLEFDEFRRETKIDYANIKADMARVSEVMEAFMADSSLRVINLLNCQMLKEGMEIIIRDISIETFDGNRIEVEKLSLFDNPNADMKGCIGDIAVNMSRVTVRMGNALQMKAVEGLIYAYWPLDGVLPDQETGSTFDISMNLTGVTGQVPQGGDFAIENLFAEIALDADSLVPLAQSTYYEMNQEANSMAFWGSKNPLFDALNKSDIAALWDTAMPANGYAAVGFFNLDFPGLWNHTNYLNRVVEEPGPVSFILEASKSGSDIALTGLLDTATMGKAFVDAQVEMMPPHKAQGSFGSIEDLLSNPPVVARSLAFGAQDKGWSSGLHAFGIQAYDTAHRQLNVVSDGKNEAYIVSFLHAIFGAYGGVQMTFPDDYRLTELGPLLTSDWGNLRSDIEVVYDMSDYSNGAFDPSRWPKMEAFFETPFDRALSE